jgi:hypothetical protein
MGDEFSEMVEVWKSNYGLAYNSPEDAMRWWEKATKGWAPAGAVAALGLCLIEIERLKAERNEIIEMCAEVCEKVSDDYNLGESENEDATECAAAIRALKEER